MTQDEYNKITGEEQNALVATEVLGWKLDEDNEWTSYEEHFDNWLKIVDKKLEIFDMYTFDPINNLDHAFMGVDKICVERRNCTFTLGCGEDGDFHFIFGGNPTIPLAPIWVIDLEEIKTPNEAIMLACLRAKGVVE